MFLLKYLQKDISGFLFYKDIQSMKSHGDKATNLHEYEKQHYEFTADTRDKC